ncbi:hypothetical protein [Brevundimonas sp.]|uniref:hypothetical protein n=1 Tax=Brevundimonas sp. TaxID=1871086 RepID=UPI0035B06BE7
MSAENPESMAVVAALRQASASGPHEAFLSTTVSEALLNFRHLFPELISYRGGLFIEAQFDKATVDDLFDQATFGDGEFDVGHAEDAVNSVGLFAEAVAEGDIVAAASVAEMIGWVWRRWLRETYDVEIEVLTSIDKEEGAYVSFRSASPGR